MPIATGSQQVRRAPRQGAKADGRGLMMVRSGTPEGHRSDRLIRPGPMGLRISPRAREAAASRARPRGLRGGAAAAGSGTPCARLARLTPAYNSASRRCLTHGEHTSEAPHFR